MAVPGSDGDIESIAKLSPMQQAMLVHSLVEPRAGVYVLQQSLRLTGRLDTAAFERAWRHVVARHSILRTGFFWESLERPRQVAYRQAELEIVRETWPADGEDRRQDRLERYLTADRERGFDLTRPPLMRLALFELGAESHHLVWTLHHLLVDGWSQGQLLRELFAAYAAFASGGEPRLEKARSFREYIGWLQRQDLGAAEAFWRRSLAGFTAPSFLAAGNAGNDGGRTRSPRRRELRLSTEETAALGEMARRHRLTLSTLVQGAWAAQLAVLCGREDVVFGATVAGRPMDLPGVESILGPFLNTLPLRVEVRPESRVRAWLAGLQERLAEMRGHEHAPLVDVQRWSGLPAGVPLFDHIVVFESASMLRGTLAADPTRTGGLEISGDAADETGEQTNYPLNVVVIEGSRLTLSILSDAGRFEAPAVERMLRRLAALLVAFAEDADPRLGDLPVLLAGERQMVLAEWNDTQGGSPREQGLAALFAEVARRQPDAPAVVSGGETWTYRRLEGVSNRLARRLTAGGESPGAVGISMQRSPELIAGMLAILKAGGFYVPLDAGSPEERLAFMLADSGARTVLGEKDFKGLEDTKDQKDGNGWAPAASLAYVMYTSGSTGRPKGVAVPQRAVVRLVRESGYVELGPGDRVAHVSNPSFDAATFEIWGALLNGGTVVVVPREVSLAPAALAGLLRGERVTALFLTTALFNQVAREEPGAFSSLRYVLFGGEMADPGAVALALERGPERLLHVYGPTESTTFASWHQVTEAGSTIPIGRPLADTTLWVLDRSLAAVPAEAPGEICLGGDGLAWGYWNQPALTAERFVPHPWGDGERLYRTGDLARRRPDGAVEFLGRLDDQVKIRGIRIEPGEVETALLAHPEVRAAVVLAREEAAGRRLVAWVVLAPLAPDTAAGGLRSWLAARLPEALVPAAFVVLPALPLTPNGKVDRRALPTPEQETGSEAPSDLVEELLAGLWAGVLGLPRVGLHDDFFALGGHSLLATQVVSRIRGTFGVELPLRTVFEVPTVAELAAAVREARSAAAPPAAPILPIPPIPPGAREAGIPLSFAQQRLWLLDQIEPGNPAYTIPLAVRLSGAVSVGLLAGIFGAVVRRHEALRTGFSWQDGEPAQVIHPPGEVDVPVADLSALPAERRLDTGLRLARAEALRPFELFWDPLLRLTLVRLAETDHLLLVSMHHIVSDGWSMGVFLREIAAFYAAASTGRPADVPELPVQYADFAVWQRAWLHGEVLDAQLAFWKNRLAGAPQILELPIDRPRPAAQSYRGAALGVSLPPALAAAVRALCRARGVTPFMALLAAWAVVLSRHSGRHLDAQGDVLIGTPIAGRNRREIESLIGFFVNTLVLRVDLSAGVSSGDRGSPPFADLLARVRAAALDAYAHQDLPFERVVGEIATERDLARSPLFQVMLAWQNAPGRRLAVPGLELAPVALDSEVAKFDLNLSLWETPERSGTGGDIGGIAGALEHTDLFDGVTVQRLWGRFTRLLEAAVGHPGVPVADLPLLLPAEEHQALAEWNDTAAPLSMACLHELVEAQVDRSPDSVAVETAGGSLTYRELELRANRLASRLRALGAGPESRVGLCAERTPEMVIGMLAVLKAGAAWVPLDPEAPRERLPWLLADSGVRVLLARRHLVGRIPATDVRIVVLEERGEWTRQEPLPEPGGGAPLPVAGRAMGEGTGVRAHGGFQDNLSAGAGPASLACLLYTSGSTGRPKGVLVPHGGLVNRLLWAQAAYPVTAADRVLQKASFSFDFSLWECFAPLLAGGCLVLAAPGEQRDPAALVRTIGQRRITLVHFIPSLLRLFVAERGLEDCASLRAVFSGGEALPLDLAALCRGRLPAAVLRNQYGPTEISIDTTDHVYGRDDAARGFVPLGRPLANTAVHVLDGNLRPVPAGVAGELFVGGIGVTRGYLGRPGLTADRFVPNPFWDPTDPSDRSDRLYRTGDRALRLPDGHLKFLGRTDHQVKIRGFRIEPGEIEAVLRTHPEVSGCAILAREDRPGDTRLVAYVVGSPALPALPTTLALRAFLAERLPDHLVPAAFVVLAELPLTPTGKLDRQALPAPSGRGSEGPAEEDTAAPSGPVQELLAGIWAEVLRLDRVGARDNFFSLGGHSLLATQVVSRIRETFGVEIPLRRLFEAPTLERLAAVVAAAQGEGPGVPAAVPGGESPAAADLAALLDGLDRLSDAEAGVLLDDPRALRSMARSLAPASAAPEEAPEAKLSEVPPAPAALPRGAGENRFPLSFAQQRLWFLDQLEPDSPAYNVPMPVRLRGELPAALLARTAAALVRRHETLRTTFLAVEGRPVQVVHAAPEPAALHAALLEIDLSGVPAAVREAEARRVVHLDAWQPFDLRRGPLLRLRLLRLAPRDHLLLFTLHHIISDAWSMRVLLREVGLLFGDSPLPALEFQYADFAVWQREWLQGRVLAEQLAYWEQQLAGAPAVLEIPTDRPRPAVQSFRGASVGRELESGVAAAVRELCRREDVTPFMAFAAAWAVLLARQSGQDEVVIGTPIAGRHIRGSEHLIGFFANTLVLRFDLRAGAGFRALLASTRRMALDAFSHQDLPFERLVEELAPARDPSRSPLFQAMFVLHAAGGEGLRIPGLTIEPVPFDIVTAKFDLLLNVADLGGRPGDGFACSLEHGTDLFTGERMLRFLENLSVLLAAATAEPERPLPDLPLLGAAESERVLCKWNAGRADEPRVCVHRPVEEQAERTPDVLAVVWSHVEKDGGDGTVTADESGGLTYRELDQSANRLARHLRSLGVAADDRVAICLERSVAMAVAVLAVLKAGAAYVPLDPDYPADRVAYMLDDSRSKALITTSDLAAALHPTALGTAARRVLLDVDAAAVAAQRGESLRMPLTPLSPDNLAYVIYTSGSTGRPKGVAMPHGMLSNLIRWQTRTSGAGVGTRTIQFASLSFDASFHEMFSTWWTGGTLVGVSQETRRDPMALAAVLRAWNAGRLFLPFVALQALAEAIELGAPPPLGLREIFTSGEQLRITRQIRAWLGASGIRLENHYGPTEGHVVTGHRLTGPAAGWPDLPPIGRPLSNVAIYLLDRSLAPVPQGALGLLYIGGVQVVRGYLGRPELTAATHVPDPFSAEPGARLYATGDQARFLEDGSIQFFGRVDQQVKIRGFRVEPGEVESALARHPAVRAAAVVVRGLAADQTAADKALVAYYVADAPLAAGELTAFLKKDLPEHMVPAVIVRLDALPLTPSGKVDRKALPAPAAGGPVEERDAPADPVEEILAAIWAEVLHCERVGVHEDFFALGGHSLLATQVTSRIRRTLGVELPLRQLFETPTVAGYARAIRAADRRAVVAPPITPMPPALRQGAIPLSFAQQRLWWIDQLDPGSTAYNLPLAVRLSGAITPATLERIFGEIVRRHEVLRTTFAIGAAEPVQPVQVIAEDWRPDVRQVDLSAFSDRTDRKARARKLAIEEARQPFDLARGPLLRLALLRLADEEHLLLLTMHHIVTDGWSMGVLLREIAALYEGSSLPEPAVQYADFAVWQRSWLSGEVLAAQIAFWKARLDGAPHVLELPADRPRPAQQTMRGAACPVTLPPALAEAVRGLCRGRGATPYMVLLAAWGLLLGRHAGQDDVLVGTPIAGRNHREIEDLIGFFVNTLVLRVDLRETPEGEPSFADLLARVRGMALDAYAHQDLPFERLVEELAPERDLSRSPLFQALLVLQNAPSGELRLPGLSLAAVEVDSGIAKFDLTLVLSETADSGFAGALEHNADLFDAGTASRLAARFTALLETAAGDPGRSLWDLPLLLPAERHQVLWEWNDVAAVNTTLVVLDRKLGLVPPGVVGELCIGGDGLASGDLNRPELTAERFIPDPYGDGGRLYRSGDLGRQRRDGTVEALGRLDDPVKIRGFRMGPADRFVAPRDEVERQIASIWEELLDVRPVGVTDDFFALGGHSLNATQVVSGIRSVLGVDLPLRRLFEHPTVAGLAQAVRKAGQGEDGESERDAGRVLPGGGFPDTFHDLEAVAAARPEPSAPPPPRPAVSTRLAELSAEKRRLLDAVLREQRAAAAGVILPREDSSSPVPLSFSQERMWFLHQLDPASAVYNVVVGVRLAGALRPGILAAAFAQLLRRHQVLATRYELAGSHPVQVIDSGGQPSFAIPLFDLSGLAANRRTLELDRLRAEESGRPFDLLRGPVLRARLVYHEPGEHTLLLTVHHIAVDGWSLGILLPDLAALYASLAGLPGAPPPPAPRLQYADFAVWQRRRVRGEALGEQQAYWRRQLAPPLPVLSLPTDRPRGTATQSFRLATETLSLPAGLTAALHALGNRLGASLFMVLLSGLAAVLQRSGGDERILVGTPVAGRNRRELEELVGFFLNTLVLRVDLEGDPDFSGLLQATAETALEAFAHQDLPLETLLQELRLERGAARGPFQVMLLLQNLQPLRVEAPGLTLTALGAEGQADLGTAIFELGLTVLEDGGELHAVLSYNAMLLDAATPHRLLVQLRTLLAGAAAEPATRLSSLPLLAPEEQAQVAAWNEAAPALPGAPIHILFAEQAARTPAAEAVRHGGRRMTYGELDLLSLALADHLRASGVGPEAPVAVFLERSPELIAALLAVQRAGGVYAPLDPALPAERLAWILDDLRPAVLLTEAALSGRISWGGKTLLVDRLGEASFSTPAAAPAPGQAAYVIYTSGSTGRPKGVVVSHGALSAFVAAVCDLYAITERDRVLQFASPSFDASVEEIYPCLTQGGTLVLRTDEMAATLAGFLRGCTEHGITVLDLPTAFWHELAVSPELDAGLSPAVRLVILGGERPLPERVAAWLHRTGPDVRLLNTYGPTEATVVATAADLPPAFAAETWREVPVGRPLAGASAHVLDGGLRPVPVGVLGELFLGGTGVARGYLGRPDLTAERFLPDPFAAVAPMSPMLWGARLYRSGDLARRRADGSLELAGRVDAQVKIRGFRVEPGEIESVLAASPEVAECAVVAREVGDARSLVAYVVAPAGTKVSAADLRAFLEARLPAFMVPAAFAALPALPRTVTGKIDRRSLPAPGGPGVETARAYVAPRTDVEEIIAGIWREALGLDRVSVHDGFFELGGHSLLLLQVMRRLREAFDLEVPLRSIYEERTVEALALKVEELLLHEISRKP